MNALQKRRSRGYIAEKVYQWFNGQYSYYEFWVRAPFYIDPKSGQRLTNPFSRRKVAKDQPIFTDPGQDLSRQAQVEIELPDGRVAKVTARPEDVPQILIELATLNTSQALGLPS